ncbi:ectonucleotide pyrophosphatase phosphodiesterase [Ptychographa xylographoides]|nr:ectonucleotide pyrophosphatase phosphodiesterase [Ptychographa xylographoides]
MGSYRQPDLDDEDVSVNPLDHDREVLEEDFEQNNLLKSPTLDGEYRDNVGGRVRRRSRRRNKKIREKQREKDEGGSLMYEMEEGGRDDSSNASSRSSMEREIPPSTKRSRRTKLLHLVLLPAAIVVLLCLLVLGAYNNSRTSQAKSKDPLRILSNGSSAFAPTTILISLDGFRADFLNRNLTPTLNSFIAEGVSPKYMLPSFPSITFPNHYTLVTGLYPESHGIVSNTFWDPEFQEEFHSTDPAHSMQSKWWDEAEPLWVTASKQNTRSAIHMWPGSEAHIQMEPAFLDKYNGTEVLSRKVARVLEFIDYPSEHDPGYTATSNSRPQFIAFYVPNVDTHGHLYGPNSTEIRTTIKDVDTMLHNLFTGLKDRNLSKIVNIVVVSDHGMATTSTDRVIQLDDLVDLNLIEHIEGWPLHGLRPKDPKDLQSLYETLAAKSFHNSRFEVYARDKNMPERYHFSNNKRIAPLWIIPKTGWAIVEKKNFDVQEAKKTGRVFTPQGLHGYDHEHPLMRAIFVARGPAFPHKPNSRLEVFQNTEVYNIVCDSLGIQPRPNNGTLRLPLRPIGLHSDDPTASEEGPTDPPTDPPSTAPTLPTTAPFSAPLPIGIDAPAPVVPPRPVVGPVDDSLDGDAGNGDSEDKGSEKENEQGEEEKEKQTSDWWRYVVDKVNGVKNWAASLWGDKKSENFDEADDNAFDG